MAPAGSVSYVHVRAGRERRGDVGAVPGFVGTYDDAGKLTRVRVRRGTHYSTGDVIATVNAFNHVHLNVGWPGEEINPLRLRLTQFSDTIAPTIAARGVHFFSEDWPPITVPPQPLSNDRDPEVAIGSRFVAADVARAHADDVLAWRERCRVPEALAGNAVDEGVGHDIEKPRAPPAIERNAAAGRIDEPRRHRAAPPADRRRAVGRSLRIPARGVPSGDSTS